VRLIFDLCVTGFSVLQIANRLNRDKTPTFPRGKSTAKEWSASGVALVLRNEAVLGYYQPRRREGAGRVSVGLARASG
jgi:hypothetical protein